MPRWAKGSYQSSKSIDSAFRTAAALDVVMIEPGQVPVGRRDVGDALRRIGRLMQDQRERLGRREKPAFLEQSVVLAERIDKTSTEVRAARVRLVGRTGEQRPNRRMGPRLHANVA